LEKRATRPPRRDLRAQTGYCDFPITDLACPSVFDCACSGCDWPGSWQKKKEKRAALPSYRQQTEDAIQVPIPDESE